MDKQQAASALRAVAQAEVLARWHSQSNGVLLLVWGGVIFATMTGFDILPRLAARFLLPAEMRWLAPLTPAFFLLPIVLAAAVWSGRYAHRLPVQSCTPSNCWLFVGDTARRQISWGAGWWAAWHPAVLLAGMALGFWIKRWLHLADLLPGTFSVIGLVDAAPLLIVGMRLWRQARGPEIHG